MEPLSWEQARECVRRKVLETPPQISQEIVPIEDARGRVLAIDVVADRPYPPFPRATRDGFALRAADLPGRLKLVGEVRAGETSSRAVGPGECIEVMTGAPSPSGADAIVMVEHVARDGDVIEVERVLRPGDNIAAAGCEACAGERVLSAGSRLDYVHVAVLASVGVCDVQVFVRPKVCVVSTGDEIVSPRNVPKSYQIRNSNGVSLAAQVTGAGGQIAASTQAADSLDAIRDAIRSGLNSDLLLLSGGVSAGKYDLVEDVLTEFDAEFFFTRVLIQPGQPAVFGRAGNKFFFGLPGNPASTMVTFELFARLAIELLSGETSPALRLSTAFLTAPFQHKTGLTRFLPASLNEDGSRVTPVRWQGSGDVFALARANAFLVADPVRESWNAGDAIQVMPR